MRNFALGLALWLPFGSLQTAREFYQKTEYRAALEALDAGHSSAPDVWHWAGRAHFQLGEYQKAQDLFEKAARVDAAGSGGHYHWLGKTLGRRAESANFLTAPKLAVECRKAFEKAVEAEPANVEAWSDLLEYYLSAPGLLGGGLDKATAAAQRIGALDAVEKEFALAKLAEKQKEWAGAERHWRQAAELAPGNAGRWLDLARFLARRGRYAESDQALERAARAEPKAPKVWFARAETNIESKRDLAGARELLHRYLATQLTPDDPSKDEAKRLLKKIP